MYRIPTILTIALLMLAGPALTGTSALEAQTCPPSVCSGPPPSRGPFGVQAVVNGTTVTLSWELPPGTNIFLEVFIRQGPRIFAGWVGAVTSVTGTLPPGTYSFTISTDGLSRLAGADFTVESSAPGVPPGVPGMPTVTLIGQFVTLNWAAPVSGGPVIDYQLEAGSAPGASNTAIVRTVAPTLSATAPPGIYYVRVRARNAAGLGPASSEVVIDVSAPSGPWRLCSTAVPSIVSLVPVPVEFVNTSSQPRKLYWIDFAGTRQSYGVLAPGQSGFITSFITHSWVVTDLAEACLGTLVISGGGRIATP
jgi:VHL beta domain